ncbi:hypothetical protein GCM10017667_25090 [Streptomyces filamentosus]|uniref:Spore-associated protein A n=1 Tax=Streptomyces filamentosus TaxID=67294 RepID=A0A919EKB1_STRFL|nr:hypothetical protein GCM10017667_25090 [Streptomyces filamentosus]
MPSTKNRIMATIAALASILGFALISAPAASAGGYGCSGGLIATYPVKTSSGTIFGNIHVYYDSSTGRNCAVTVKTTAGGYGTSSFVSVTLAVCKTSTPGAFCDSAGQPTAYEGDHFNYYAGPVSVYAAGRCIHLYGQVSSVAPIATGQSGSGGVHCG